MTQPKTGSKFTPGPYEVVKLHDGGVGVAKQGLGTVIATFHDYVEHENGQEAEPNARFYKAAPEMYELLSVLAKGNYLCPNKQTIDDEAGRPICSMPM